jgi:hypothetical protein
VNRRTGLISAVLLCALLGAGCGDDDSSPAPATEATPELTPTSPPAATPPLSASGMRVIQRARDTVSAHCRQVADALAEGAPPPPGGFERATAALDELARLAAEQPDAEAEDGTTPRLALGDIAENLEGTNCDARLVARIDEALAVLPAG